MAGIFSDFISGNNPKIDEILVKTREVAETVGKKSAEHLDLSRRRIEFLDIKSKQAQLFEQFGQLQYKAYMGEETDEEEIASIIEKITANKERIELLEEEIEATKTKFTESVQHTKEMFRKEMEKASAPRETMDVSEFFESEDDIDE